MFAYEIFGRRNQQVRRSVIRSHRLNWGLLRKRWKEPAKPAGKTIKKRTPRVILSRSF